MGACQTQLLQTWVSKPNTKKICVHVKNNNPSGGCPLKMTGIRLSMYDATGLALDTTQKFAKIEGGERRIDVIEFLHIARALGFDASRAIRAIEKR